MRSDHGRAGAEHRHLLIANVLTTCLGAADSAREVVEGAVGAWSTNEYFEMQIDGLTPQLT